MGFFFFLKRLKMLKTATLNCKSLWQEAFVMSTRVQSNTPGSLAPHISGVDSWLLQAWHAPSKERQI